MSNLIITIIGIALVAVAAIFGIYYGSIAYDGAVAKSNAQQITKAAQQIQTAALIWRSENGAQYPGDGGKAAWYNALKTDYLQDAHNASKLIKLHFQPAVIHNDKIIFFRLRLR